MTADRRIDTRHPVPTMTSNPLAVTVGLLPRSGLVADLSAGGLSVLLAEPPPTGAMVPVWLPGPPGRPSLVLLAQVMYATADGALFRVGLMAADDTGRAVLAEVMARR